MSLSLCCVDSLWWQPDFGMSRFIPPPRYFQVFNMTVRPTSAPVTPQVFIFPPLLQYSSRSCLTNLLFWPSSFSCLHWMWTQHLQHQPKIVHLDRHQVSQSLHLPITDNFATYQMPGSLREAAWQSDPLRCRQHKRSSFSFPSFIIFISIPSDHFVFCWTSSLSCLHGMSMQHLQHQPAILHHDRHHVGQPTLSERRSSPPVGKAINCSPHLRFKQRAEIATEGRTTYPPRTRLQQPSSPSHSTVAWTASRKLLISLPQTRRALLRIAATSRTRLTQNFRPVPTASFTNVLQTTGIWRAHSLLARLAASGKWLSIPRLRPSKSYRNSPSCVTIRNKSPNFTVCRKITEKSSVTMGTAMIIITFTNIWFIFPMGHQNLMRRFARTAGRKPSTIKSPNIPSEMEWTSAAVSDYSCRHCGW